MYLPPAFKGERLDVLRGVVRNHPLALLVTLGLDGVTANALPFTLIEGEQDVLRAHLAKANGQLADLAAGGEALVVFQGPEAYVTPSWYETKRQTGEVVPTWNYVMVQARGRPRLVDDPDWLRDQLTVMTAEHERDRPAPWSIDEAPDPFISSKVKGIVGLEIPIERLEGKWKVSQNQPAVNRASVISGLRGEDATSQMAALVEGHR